MTGSVIDTMTDEEYLPLRQTNPAGNYVYGVRYAYEELLRGIAEACFVCLPFASAQANRISKRVRETWGDAPEFPWKEKTYAANGVFRHPVTQKWYGLIMPVTWEKLVSGRDGRVEILNVKATDAARAIEQDGCYPAYHMNKRYWISIALDDTVTDEE
ncbi:MAG: MmcQ/YjbR family DNA-binding protein, partial [Veillonellaceae bacterium]|nr:MmcQ/YjbR family DNA-binding protein [Veillonellaceae bacterium]